MNLSRCMALSIQGHKISIPRLPTNVPDADLLTPFEERYLQCIRDGRVLFRFDFLQFSRQDGSRLCHNLFRRFGPTFSSQPVRYACVLYMLNKRKGALSNDHDHMHYLNLFYKSTHAAIEHKAYPELVYSCFAGCMYALCARRNFQEIVAHATAFQLAANNLRQSAAISGEETFFLDCMWEKLVWTMARELLFKQKLTPKMLNRLAKFSEPLFVSDYKDQPVWIQEACWEVRVKIDLIRSLIYFELSTSNDFPLVNAFLAPRFSRDFVTCIGSGINRSNPKCWESRGLLRTISRTTWSSLLNLASELLLITSMDSPLTPSLPGSIQRTIESIFTAFDLVPEPQDCEGLRAELFNVVDMAVCSLVLLGLVVNQFHQNENSFPVAGSKLIGLVLPLIKSRFERCLALVRGQREKAWVLSVYEQLCFELESRGPQANRLEALFKWMTICGCGLVSQ
jgi:hypothetical protein